MRGLAITVEQAARLFGIPGAACARILAGLVREGLLRLRTDGRYAMRDSSR
jgi:DNA-binding IclR family transcriptional regulator